MCVKAVSLAGSHLTAFREQVTVREQSGKLEGEGGRESLEIRAAGKGAGNTRVRMPSESLTVTDPDMVAGNHPGWCLGTLRWTLRSFSDLRLYQNISPAVPDWLRCPRAWEQMKVLDGHGRRALVEQGAI